MSTHRQLLEAMRADPDDDTVRLVFADWCAEQGEWERGAFVRAQVLEAALDPHDPDRIGFELEARRQRASVGERWHQERPDLGPNVTWGRYHRGFERQVAFADPQQWNAHGPACLDQTLVEGVALPWWRSTKGGIAPKLAAHPRLRELTVYGPIVDETDAQWLADSPILSTIRRLSLIGTDLTSGALRRILQSPHLGALEALTVAFHSLDDVVADVLQSWNGAGLQELDLTTHTLDELGSGGRDTPTMGPIGAERLAAWPGLASVRRLSLTGQQLTREGLAALLGSPHLTALEDLDLRGISDWDWDTGDRPDVLSAFADAHPDLRLRSLTLGECNFSAEDAQLLAQSPALSELRALHIELVQGQDDAFTHLAEAPWIRGLRRLAVQNIDANSPFWPRVLKHAATHLHTLSLVGDYHWSRQTDLVRWFEAHPLALRRLHIETSFLDDDQLTRIGNLDTLPELQELTLHRGYLPRAMWTEEGTRALANGTLGARLISLDVDGDGDLSVHRIYRPIEPDLPLGRWGPRWPL